MLGLEYSMCLINNFWMNLWGLGFFYCIVVFGCVGVVFRVVEKMVGGVKKKVITKDIYLLYL